MAQFAATTVANDLTSSVHDMRAGQSFQGYYAYWKNNVTYNINFSVRNIGAGAAWWCSACYNHSGNSYGAGNESYLVRYSGAGASMYTMHNYGTAAGGNISWAQASTTLLRLNKNPGWYGGWGGCVVQVNGPT